MGMKLDRCCKNCGAQMSHDGRQPICYPCKNRKHKSAFVKKEQMEVKLTRCLGPGLEHYFRSSGAPGHRMCPRCREAVKTIDEPKTYSIVMEN